MPLSDEQLRDEQCKARRLAMLQAMEMIESQPGALCASCSRWEDKYRKDTSRLFQEVGHLREALQKMVDQLASHMPGEKLRSFLKDLKLDSRIFTIHAGGDFYKEAPAEEPPAAKERLEDVVSERDVAKMRLASLSKELREMKSERESLEKQKLEQGAELADHRKRLALTEEALRVLQEHRARGPEVAHSSENTRRQLFDSPGNDGSSLSASLELRERHEPESIEPKLHVLQVRSDLRPLQKLKPQQSSKSTLWLNSSPSSQLHGDLDEFSQVSLASLKGLPKQMQTARSQPILWPSKSPQLQRKALPVIEKYHFARVS